MALLLFQFCDDATKCGHRFFFLLIPHPGDRLAHQIVGIGALLRTEFLHATAVHFGDVEVAFLVHAHTVDTPQSSPQTCQSVPQAYSRCPCWSYFRSLCVLRSKVQMFRSAPM